MIPRQIGWSIEANLLWEIQKQQKQMQGIVSAGNPNTTTTTSTTTTHL